MRQSVRVGVVASLLILSAAALIALRDVAGIMFDFITPETELQTDLLSLTAPLSIVSESDVMATGERVATENGLKAPKGAETGVLWPMQQVYIGPRYEAMWVAQSSVDYIISLTKRPSDAQTYERLVEQVEQGFAPLGFKRRSGDGR